MNDGNDDNDGQDGNGPRLGIEGTRFTLDGRPAFLLGISYYAGQGAPEAILREDLERIREHGFNWIRVWTTWAAFGHDVSSVDGDGFPRAPYLDRLEALVEECGQRGLVVDVTFSRGNGVTGPPRLQGLEAHQRAVAVVVNRLKGRPNWYLDLANERNLKDQRFVSYDELQALRRLVRELDPARLVTASHASADLTRDDVREYVHTVGVDFLAPHRPRHAGSPAQTADRTREALAWGRELGKPVPVHYQEPFRRGFGRWEPPAAAFLEDLQGALSGGAAGWCFHNGDRRQDPDGRPRRSFDLREQGLFEQLDEEERRVLAAIRRLDLSRWTEA
jgi:hypothetical protein